MTTSDQHLESFEVADGDTFGDLLSADRLPAPRPVRIGLVATGFFEYWRMYPVSPSINRAEIKITRDR